MNSGVLRANQKSDYLRWEVKEKKKKVEEEKEEKIRRRKCARGR